MSIAAALAEGNPVANNDAQQNGDNNNSTSGAKAPYRFAKGAAALVMAAFDVGNFNFNDSSSQVDAANTSNNTNNNRTAAGQQQQSAVPGTSTGLPVSTSTGNFYRNLSAHSRSSIGNLADLAGFPTGSRGSFSNLHGLVVSGADGKDGGDGSSPAVAGELTTAQVSKLAQPVLNLLTGVSFYSIMGGSTQVVVLDVNASLATAFIAAQESRVSYLLLWDPDARPEPRGVPPPSSDPAAPPAPPAPTATGTGQFCGVFTMDDVVKILLYCHENPQNADHVGQLSIREAKEQDWMGDRRVSFDGVPRRSLISGHPDMSVHECLRLLIDLNTKRTEGEPIGNDPLAILSHLSPDEMDSAGDDVTANVNEAAEGGGESLVGVLTWPILLTHVGRMLVASGELLDTASSSNGAPSNVYKSLYEVPIRNLPKLGKFVTGYRCDEDDDEGEGDDGEDAAGGGIAAALAAEAAKPSSEKKGDGQLPVITPSHTVAQALIEMQRVGLDAVAVVDEEGCAGGGGGGCGGGLGDLAGGVGAGLGGIGLGDGEDEGGALGGGIGAALAEANSELTASSQLTILDVFSKNDILRLENCGAFDISISISEALLIIRGYEAGSPFDGGAAGSDAAYQTNTGRNLHHNSSTVVCTLDDSFGDVLAHFCNTNVKEMFVVSSNDNSNNGEKDGDNAGEPQNNDDAVTACGTHLVGQLGLREVLDYLYKAGTAAL